MSVSVAAAIEAFHTVYIDPDLWSAGGYNGAAMLTSDIAPALRYYLLYRATNGALTAESAGEWLADFIQSDGRMLLWSADHETARARFVARLTTS